MRMGSEMWLTLGDVVVFHHDRRRLHLKKKDKTPDDFYATLGKQHYQQSEPGYEITHLKKTPNEQKTQTNKWKQ